MRVRVIVAALALLVVCVAPFAAQTTVTLPENFTPPEGFALVERLSRHFAFDHQEMAYLKAGTMTHIDPEGKTWRIFLSVTPPNKTGEATDASMRAALKAQGWDLLTASGTLVAHRVKGGKEQWFQGAAFAGEFRLVLIEPGPAPHPLTLTPPAAAVEDIKDTENFPYLGAFPGATLLRTAVMPGETFTASPPGAKEQLLAGAPLTSKFYTLPAIVSPYEYMATYRDALAKAGWTIIMAKSGGDSVVVAHYAKNGRDLYCYLHGDRVNVADIGAQNDAKKLAAALDKEGHVAIYGIYFDIDKATLKPEAETALRHVLALLQGNASLALEVQGHTDNTGNAAANQTLSEQRAASVKQWLVEHGVAAARLAPQGYGATKPVADNNSPEGRSKNRRVELTKTK